MADTRARLHAKDAPCSARKHVPHVHENPNTPAAESGTRGRAACGVAIAAAAAAPGPGLGAASGCCRVRLTRATWRGIGKVRRERLKGAKAKVRESLSRTFAQEGLGRK